MDRLILDDEIGGWGITAWWVSYRLGQMSGDIEVVIDSPGGDVFEGVQIYNALKSYDGRVHIVINSLAASIASYIAMAGDTITCKSNSTFMIHNVWTIAVGDHNDLRKEADVAEGLTGIITKAYAARTGKSEEEIRTMLDEETYLFGQQIIDAGFADTIAVVESDSDTSAMIDSAKDRFKAASSHAKERVKPTDYKFAALAHLCSGGSCRTEERESPAYSADIMAKRYKLLTGDNI